jgi:Gpi18-like mannosyltransferase
MIQVGGNNHEPSLSLVHITTLTLVNRALIFLVAYLAYRGIADQPVDFIAPSFQDIWGKWDTRHYLNIAENGYQSEGEERVLLVFYPLYPLAIRLFHYVIGSYFWSAIAVSLTSLFAATYFLYRLVLLEFSDAVVARDSVKYLLIFPFSFFFSAAYAESLFLLLTVLTFYYCKNDRWLAAGIAAMFAALTRNHGVLLLLPLIVEAICRARFDKAGAIELVRRSSCALLALAGFGIYLCINKWVSGEWFAFIKYQNENWHNTFGFFADNVQIGFQRIFGPGISWVLGTWLPEFCIFFVAAAFLAVSARRIAPSYIVYSVAYLVISYSPTLLLSGSRYVAAMFPLFICMALFVRGHYMRRQLLELTSFLLLGLYVSMYPQTYTIF